MNKIFKKSLSLILVMTLMVSMFGVSAKAENDTDKGVCSVDNPEACEVVMPEGLLEEEPNVYVETPAVEAPAVEAAPTETKVSSPKTGEVYEEASLKSKNLPKKLENIDVTFTKPEYTNVKGKQTTKANGKPRVIIISKNNCYWCERMKEQVEGYVKDGSLKNVDIIQVNIEDSETRADAWKYIYYVSQKNSIGTPFTIYINSNNEIVEYTQGMNIKNGDILDQINDLFKNEPKTYKITYKLNLKKAKNNSKNPKKYTDKGKTIKLKAPTSYDKKKYKFMGWYTKKTGGKKVTSIKKGSTGDIKLYARWKKLNKK